MKICSPIIAVLAVLLVGVQQLHAQTIRPEDNWPLWRGPLENGVAPQADPPLTWSSTSGIKWKVRLPGDGTSTPIIWGDQIFIQTAFPAKNPEAPRLKGEKGAKSTPPTTDHYQFVLMCLDRNTGKTVWQKICREEVPHEGHHSADGSFSASSAMTDGEHVYAFFGSRGLYCFDLRGNPKWEKDLGRMRVKLGFGEGSTPALHGNTIVVNWDHEGEDFVVALDKRTGSELWRQPRSEGTSWATPLIVQHEGRSMVITCATSRIRAYDLTSGEQLWEHEGLTPNAIPTPVTANGVVYATSGYQGNKLFAIRLGKSGDLTGSDSVLWSLNRDTPYVPSPLLSGEKLFFIKSNSAILSCLDIRTGKPHFSAQRIEGLQSIYASPVAATGRIYLVGRNGTTVVIKDSDKLEILATNELNDPTDASPALVGKHLFLRSRQNLYCFGEK